MAVITGAQALVGSLKANGIDTIFGLPGVQLDHIFDALHAERDAIRVIHSRHEQGAAYMAYGYAESTGKLGTYLVVPGPGLLNTATALCTAHASNAPVLALTGQIATRFIGRGLGILHEVSQPEAMLAPVTKHQAFADHPSRAPHVLNRCIAQALSARQGPVLFQMPEDVTSQRGDVAPFTAASLEPPAVPDPDVIARAAKLLGESRKPLLFVGGGAFGAEEELLELAKALEAPVVMTRHARGAVSDREYLAQTLIGGQALWADADVVLAVGTRFMESETWGLDAGIRTIRIDVDPIQAERPRSPDLKIIGQAKQCLAAIVNVLPAHNRRRASREAELKAVKQGALAKIAVLEPQKQYSDALRAALPEEGILVCDITQVGFYTWTGFPAYRPRSIIYPGYQDSLGYGYATALGVKVANPDRPVVAICGDGGFMFTMPEMATAVKHGINLVAVVFNDGRFGNVRRTQQQQFGERYIGSDLANPDFMKLADAFGMNGMRASSAAELGAAVGKALAANAPALIEVPVGAMPAWQPLMPRGAVRGAKG
jgi:acetolactate synthase-1/2/3 large subunit